MTESTPAPSPRPPYRCHRPRALRSASFSALRVGVAVATARRSRPALKVNPRRVSHGTGLRVAARSRIRYASTG
eukprot:2795795-Rhodomonas_salina.2